MMSNEDAAICLGKKFNLGETDCRRTHVMPTSGVLALAMRPPTENLLRNATVGVHRGSALKIVPCEVCPAVLLSCWFSGEGGGDPNKPLKRPCRGLSPPSPVRPL